MLLLLADENFPRNSFNLLKEEGYDIKHIQVDNASISDHEVIKIAIDENRIIITFDSDFGELVFKTGYKPRGIIFFRWREFRPSEPGRYLHQLIQNQSINLDGYFTVIDENQIRQRKI